MSRNVRIKIKNNNNSSQRELGLPVAVISGFTCKRGERVNSALY